jgi:CSLREA domain-containing protein
VSFRDQLRKLRDETCDRGAYETLTPTRTLTVNTLADTTPNGCTAQDCTLREAIQEANSSDQLAIITFDSALFASGPQIINLTRGQLEVEKHLILEGPGAHLLTVRGRQAAAGIQPDRHFWIKGGVDKLVRLKGMTLADGRLTGGGGSIHTPNTQLVLEDMHFLNNTAGEGGALFGGQLVIQRTTFTSNRAVRGGAIFVNVSPLLSISNTSFRANEALASALTGTLPSGSAIYLNSGVGSAYLYNSTFHGNITIYKTSNPPMNQRVGTLGADPVVSVFVANTILDRSRFAWRTDVNNPNTQTELAFINNCVGNIISQGNNIDYPRDINSQSTCNFYAQGDNLNDPKLDVSADLPPPVIVYPVGSIPVIRLQSISPAINAGNSDICNGSLVGGRDGRGAKRPPVNCDIGAYEYGSETAEFPDTIGVFRPSGSTFYLRFSNTTGPADIAVVFGVSTDLPMAGDWNGDGRSTIGVYRPSTGTFFLKNANTFDAPIAYTFTFSGASPNSVPIVGDWDADGRAGVGLYNANTGQVLLRNALSTGFADHTLLFGMTGDLPLTGDWDGDGQDSFGIYRGDTFYLTNQVCSNNCIPTADYAFVLGNVGDVPFAGDWNGNGRDGAGVFRPTNGITYFKNELTTGFADIAIVYGIAGDKPVAGVWQFSGADQANPPEQPSLAPTFVPRQ